MNRISTVEHPSERLEFLQGTLEVLILRCLQRASNHAYGISQLLTQQSGNEFAVDNGSLYPALQRLLQRGWIIAEWKMSPNGRRAPILQTDRVWQKTSGGGDVQMAPFRRSHGTWARAEE